ncbi:FAD-dependent oxidoreductase [Actinomadura keratinilytica]
MPTHLTWLVRRLEAAGGRVERRTVTSLAEAAEGARAVVNCTGLGAARLVPDAGMRPVRGQLVVVENPGVDTWFTHTGTGAASTYFIPQPGAAAGRDRRGRGGLPGARPGDRAGDRGALRRAAAGDRRGPGARPPGGAAPRAGRRVRLEREELPGGGVLVHNYGHGGAGVTVAWGCADEVAALVDA